MRRALSIVGVALFATLLIFYLSFRTSPMEDCGPGLTDENLRGVIVSFTDSPKFSDLFSGGGYITADDAAAYQSRWHPPVIHRQAGVRATAVAIQLGQSAEEINDRPSFAWRLAPGYRFIGGYVITQGPRSAVSDGSVSHYLVHDPSRSENWFDSPGGAEIRSIEICAVKAGQDLVYWPGLLKWYGGFWLRIVLITAVLSLVLHFIYGRLRRPQA